MFRMQKPPKQKKMVPKPARLAKYKQRGCKTVPFLTKSVSKSNLKNRKFMKKSQQIIITHFSR